MQTTVVKKWGNSLALRLPQHVTGSLHITEGSTVSLTVEDASLIVRASRKRYKLADLLVGMKAEKRQGEVDWGKAEGEEIW